MIDSVDCNINFKGYDARPLYALVMRNTDGFALNGITRELREIGAKHGFKVLLEDKYSPFEDEDSKTDTKKKNISLVQKASEFISGRNKPHITSWMQDVIYFLKGKILVDDCTSPSFDVLGETLGFKKEEVPARNFVAGGNLYILRDGEDEKILVGKSESIKNVLKMFPNREIIRLPQADFHIDLFVRPLKENVVLVADDDMTLDMLKRAAGKLEELVEQSEGDENLDKALSRLYGIIGQMETGRRNSDYRNTDKVISTLEENDFKVVRTPGRVYKTRFGFSGYGFSIINRLNYINALVFEDKNGELCYISNKSNLDKEIGITPGLAKKIGLDFEKEFKNAISPYVKSENVYFVEGQPQEKNGLSSHIPYLLEKLGGGIHCLCAEIPKDTLEEQSCGQL